jgi:hypothetical protein
LGDACFKGLIVELGGTIGEGSGVVGVSWSSGIGDWGSVVNLGDWGNSLDDSWSLSVDNSVESVDGVSGVGDSSDGTVWLDKGVLSRNNISISGLMGGLGVSGDSVGDGVSVVVLWVCVIWLRGDSDGCQDQSLLESGLTSSL